MIECDKYFNISWTNCDQLPFVQKQKSRNDNYNAGETNVHVADWVHGMENTSLKQICSLKTIFHTFACRKKRISKAQSENVKRWNR